MAISLNRCLHLRWVQTLKFYFCNYMCSTFSHIFMSGLGRLQHLWILPLFCRCTLLYFLVFKLFPNFLASLCSCIFLFYFGHHSELVLLPVTFLSHWFDSPASLFYSLFIRNPIFPFFCCRSVCSSTPIRICLQGTFLVAVGFCFSSVVQGALSNQLWTALVASR